MNIIEFLQRKNKYIDVVNDILKLQDNENIYIGNAACNLSKMLAALTYLKDLADLL